MQFIKSLFCWQGFDNRQRFILILLSSLCFFSALSAIISDSKFLSSIILFLCTVISLMTTKRRQNDAQFNKKWLMAPAGSLLITGLIIVWLGYGMSYWLLVFPVCLSLVLLTYPSKNRRHYVLGYSGPVNLSEFKKTVKSQSRNSQRVEPTINSIDVNPSNNYPHTSNADNTAPTSHKDKVNSFTDNSTCVNSNTSQELEFAESLRLTLFSKINTRLTIAVVISFFVLVLLIFALFSNNTEVEHLVEEKVPAEEITTFEHKLTLPDNFSIMFNAQNALVVHWQADILDNNELWLLGTAIGDKSCKAIEFNNELPIRTLKVSTKNNGFYATFSPLDTKALIKNIAFKNNFALCGYKFSLKGSQAALGKSAFYSPLVEY